LINIGIIKKKSSYGDYTRNKQIYMGIIMKEIENNDDKVVEEEIEFVEL
jgi:hypothetical protein